MWKVIHWKQIKLKYNESLGEQNEPHQNDDHETKIQKKLLTLKSKDKGEAWLSSKSIH